MEIVMDEVVLSGASSTTSVGSSLVSGESTIEVTSGSVTSSVTVLTSEVIAQGVSDYSIDPSLSLSGTAELVNLSSTLAQGELIQDALVGIESTSHSSSAIELESNSEVSDVLLQLSSIGIESISELPPVESLRLRVDNIDIQASPYVEVTSARLNEGASSMIGESVLELDFTPVTVSRLKGVFHLTSKVRGTRIQ